MGAGARGGIGGSFTGGTTGSIVGTAGAVRVGTTGGAAGRGTVFSTGNVSLDADSFGTAGGGLATSDRKQIVVSLLLTDC